MSHIPPFDDNGNLPPGTHWASWEEFEERFGYTLHRRGLIEGLKRAMEHLQSAGCRVVYINGSFVTNQSNPKDFDACWDSEGVDIDYLRANAPTLLQLYGNRGSQKAKYRGELIPAEWPLDDAGTTALDLFQVDREQNRKGIIAIDLTLWEK